MFNNVSVKMKSRVCGKASAYTPLEEEAYFGLAMMIMRFVKAF